MQTMVNLPYRLIYIVCKSVGETPNPKSKTQSVLFKSRLGQIKDLARPDSNNGKRQKVKWRFITSQ